MSNKLDLGKYVIVSDFDGTISLLDSNDLLFKVLGNDENQKIERMYKSGEIGTKEGFLNHFNALKIDEDTYTKFVLEHIEIDKSFKKFYNRVKEKRIPFIIVSGGFINTISIVFQKYGIQDLPVYANRLVAANGKLTVKFAYENSDCKSEFGVCGNCKLKYMEIMKDINKKVIYIGDGLTDRCAIKAADIVFAKDVLAEYCSNLGIEYIRYESFDDIYSVLFAKAGGLI